MIITKTSLLKTLRSLASFDPNGTPFVGLQLRGDSALFHRSSPSGFIQSIGYHLRGACTIVSLAHMTDCLGAVQDEQVDLSTDANGTLRLQSSGTAFADDLRVHTICDTGNWYKAHACGTEEGAYILDNRTFADINLRPFALSAPPILKHGKLMLITDFGIVLRSGMESSPIWHPRDIFIRSLSADTERLFVTQKGYWGSVGGGMETMVAGHQVGNEIFNLYDTVADTEATLPATRLVFALSKAAELAGESSAIRVSARTGITTQDQFSNRAEFSIGELPAFPDIRVTPKTAATIVAALGQSREEVVTLSAAPHGVRRFSRGVWSVNFRSTT